MSKLETRIPYKSLLSVLQQKDIWDQLRSPENIRYDRYRIVTESPWQYAGLLGGDVRFTSHPGINFNISKKFIESQNKSGKDKISKKEAGKLLTASIVHDWGELKLDGLGQGDVTFEEHKSSHEEVETIIFKKIAGRINDDSDRDYVLKIYREVVQNRDSKLGRMFNAVERIGYLSTGLRAFVGVKGERISNWHGLTGNVFSNQIIQLLEFQNDFSLVRELLEENRQLITDAFDEVSKNPILTAKDGKPSYDIDKFNLARKAWIKFTSKS